MEDGEQEKDIFDKQDEPLSDENEEDEGDFDDEGDVDEVDAMFQRYVFDLPPISSINKEGEEVDDSRLVDFEALVEENMSSDDSEGGDDEIDKDEEEEDEVEEEEGGIDGVEFTLRRHAGPAKGGRRTIHALMESMQAKTGHVAYGYDENDSLIDDEDLEGGGSAAGVLDLQHNYSYKDFRVTSEFEFPKEKAKATQKKVLKPLKDLNPPATEELKAAIEFFRDTAKPMQEMLMAQAQGKKVLKFPKELDQALLRLGKAIEQWHPKGYLVEEMFDYVSDVLPPNIALLKNKARALMGPQKKPAPGAAVPSTTIELPSGSSIMPSQSGIVPTAAATPIATDFSTLTFEEALERLRQLVVSMLADQDKFINDPSNTTKLDLRFKFDDRLLSDVEELRTTFPTQTRNGLYDTICSWFPKDIMTKRRITTKLAAFRDKRRKNAGASTPRLSQVENSQMDIELFDAEEGEASQKRARGDSDEVADVVEVSKDAMPKRGSSKKGRVK